MDWTDWLIFCDFLGEQQAVDANLLAFNLLENRDQQTCGSRSRSRARAKQRYYGSMSRCKSLEYCTNVSSGGSRRQIKLSH